MRLSDLLNDKTIQIAFKSHEKKRIIEELLGVAVNTGKVKNRELAFKAVLDRESQMSTGLEKGIAVPHAKTKAVSDIVLVLGISREGIDFKSADGKSAHLFFFVLAPEDAAAANVKLLAQIARLTSNPAFCRNLKNSESPAEALQIINDEENLGNDL
jgi:PTS system fructose-specific IIC component